MEVIIIVIISAGLAWYFLYSFLYSPKARIKSLWNEIFGYAAKIGEHKDVSEIVRIYEFHQDRAGKLVNAILQYEYPFPDTEDEETQQYITDNKYQIKHKKS